MCACCAIWPSLGLGAALRGRDRALAGLVAVPPIKVVRMPSISSHTCVEADGGGEVIRGGVQVRVVGRARITLSLHPDLASACMHIQVIRFLSGSCVTTMLSACMHLHAHERHDLWFGGVTRLLRSLEARKLCRRLLRRPSKRRHAHLGDGLRRG